MIPIPRLRKIDVTCMHRFTHEEITHTVMAYNYQHAVLIIKMELDRDWIVGWGKFLNINFNFNL